MQTEQHSIFFNAMMTGLFVGVIDTLICLAFNIGWRDATGYFPSEIVNVSSIIFVVNLCLLLVGLLFFLFLKTFKNHGSAIFLVVILLLTAILAWQASTAHRFDDSRVNHGWRGLATGLVLILGLSAACIPLLYRNRKFIDSVI